MTNEEKELTITYLTEMQEEYIEGEGYERHPLPEYYALDTAIQALEQQSSDDCVSIAELEKWLDLNFSFGGACRKLELFNRLEKELPRVAPTFPKGATNCGAEMRGAEDGN